MNRSGAVDKPRIRVDFNEIIEENVVLLSKTDEREDSDGNLIQLREGRDVALYEYNHYKDGEEEYLFAEGVVVANTFQENPVAIWCCRINEKGITIETSK